MLYIALTVFFFIEHLPEEGPERQKYVGGLSHVCILLYLIIVLFLEYI
jgi:hypothetical protein